MLDHRLARAATVVGAVFVSAFSATCRAEVSYSCTSHVELTFLSVQETSANPVGRTGLKYKTFVTASGFTGGSSANATTDLGIELGYIGGFPDGNAPKPATGAYVSFTPSARASFPGDAFGIGTIYFQLEMTDQTMGSSQWEVTCEIKSWLECTCTVDLPQAEKGYWSATAGFDLTDSQLAFEETLITNHGYSTCTTTRFEGPTRRVTLIIDGSPGTDPAQGVINLKAEAESYVRVTSVQGDATSDDKEDPDSAYWDRYK